MGVDAAHRLDRCREASTSGVGGIVKQDLTRQNVSMPLKRVAWIVTVGICLAAAVLLLFSGYRGYAGVFVAVGAAAAINIR